MKYGFIKKHPEYPVAKDGRFLQVSSSGYYSYLSRYESREKEKELLKTKIKCIFNESGGTYGPDRICGALGNKGQKASYRKISRFMAEMGLILFSTKEWNFPRSPSAATAFGCLASVRFRFRGKFQQLK